MFNNFYKYFISLIVDKLSIRNYFFHSLFRSKESIYKINDNSFWVRKNTSDIFILKEVYKNKVYGEPTGTVLDIGANIGDFSIYASNTAHVVYAFEPETANYNQLLKNIKLNGREGKVIAERVAIGSENKEVKIYKGKFNKGASSTKNNITNNFEMVNMVKLSDLIDKYNLNKINLLKIDIEGGEYDLIYGLSKEKFEIIEKIILEYHYVEGESYKDLCEYLKSFGYKISIHKVLGSLVGTGIIEAKK